MDPNLFSEAINLATNPLPGSIPERVNYRLTVKKRFEGLSAIDFFMKVVPRSNKEMWIEKIKTGNLTVNDKNIPLEYIIKAGDVTSHWSEPKVDPTVNINIKLLYADKDIWVIDKPSPLPIHASGRFSRNTLVSILERSFPDEEFKVVHRIDVNTTGIVILAKNKVAAKIIQQQFENKMVKKEYIALVEGVLEKDQLSLEQAIGNDVLIGGSRKIDASGKKAQTQLFVLQRRFDNNQSLLKLVPSTGRTNQIRLHLAKLRHPIVGDIGYKDSSYFENNPFSYNSDSLFLHAHKLTLLHPSSNQEITFTSDIPSKYNY